MDGYILRCTDKTNRLYTLGKGFQDPSGMMKSEWAFSALTWRTKEEVEEAANRYMKKCEDHGTPIISCTPIYYWYSGKNENKDD